ncbi:MAG: ROK family transcriptional regulator [Lachnospiraceae bacterium]|nr:ROK family transcriptional regulator [Lachnospiraceae bacterium]
MKNNMLVIKKSNRSRIIDLIYEQDKISKQDIAYSLGMSLPTVASHLKQLREENLILDQEMFEFSIGRKARAIQFHANARYSIGIEITPDYMDLIVLNLKKEVVGQRRVPKKYQKSSAYIQEIGQILKDWIAEIGIDQSRILGISVAVPGIVSLQCDEIVSSYILGIQKFRIGALEELLGYPVWIYNSPKAAAAAECSRILRQGSAVYLWIDLNIGAALVLDGSVFHGSNNRELEISHLKIIADGKPHYCGKKGCFGDYCEVRELSNYTDGSLERFFEKLAAGDEKISRVWEEYTTYLARGVDALRTLFDLEIILEGS